MKRHEVYFLEHVYWITMNYNEKPTVNESRKHEMIRLLSFRGFIQVYVCQFRRLDTHKNNDKYIELQGMLDHVQQINDSGYNASFYLFVFVIMISKDLFIVKDKLEEIKWIKVMLNHLIKENELLLANFKFADV